ncbi:amidohydrolase family protein [Nocardiopsis rhodophaea]|uniref:amidohydrolase family protein n=1 Tax=Nocardiopsis rhodophaea TaxID=280238 RepID=UPI0031D809F7
MPPHPIFDAHAHLAGAPEALPRMLASMDASGIERAVVVAGGALTPIELSRQMNEGGGTCSDADNAGVLAHCAQAAGRLIPFYFANPHKGPGPYCEHADHFRGLKLAPAVHGVPLTESVHDKLVAIAEGLNHPVYLHCLPRAGFTTSDLIALAARFPGVRFILGHGGIGDMDLHSVELIADHPNIHLETSGGYTCVVAAAVRRLGPGRVLFGTEYPLQHPRVELEKYRVLELGDDTWKEVAWNNIARMLGEPEL